MNAKTPIITIVLLSLTILAFSPAAYRAHAVVQPTPPPDTTWSAYGPRIENYIILGKSDFGAMFNAFTSGSIDITDWPVFASDISSFSANPDFYVTQRQAEFGIFEFNVNHHNSLYAKAQQVARVTTPPSLGTITNSTGICPTGFSRLTVTLNNKESLVGTVTGLVSSSTNLVTVQNGPTANPVTRNDAGGATPTGNYVFPSATACIVSGRYSIVSSQFDTGNAGSSGIVLLSTQSVTLSINVNYLSSSTAVETAAGIFFRQAISHMFDKASFVNGDSVLNGNAVCLDMYGPPGWGMEGSGCLAPTPLDLNQHGYPAAILNAECSDLTLDAVLTACVGAHISLYHFAAGPAQATACTLWWTQISCTGSQATAGWSSAADLDAACQLLVKAGFTFAQSTGTCAGLGTDSTKTTQPADYANNHLALPTGFQPLVFYIRSHAPRNHFGSIIAEAIDFIFGTPNNSGTSAGQCAVTYGFHQTTPCPGGAFVPGYTIREVRPIVFAAAGVGQWNFYTGGFSLGSTPDFGWSNLHSEFATDFCGGAPNPQPSNFDYLCDPAYDSLSNAGEYAGSLTAANALFNQASERGARIVPNDDVYTQIDQFVMDNCYSWQQNSGWPSQLQSSQVRTLGHGWEIAFWTMLNLRPNPQATTSNSLYACNRHGPETVIRGFSQDIDNVNLFQAQTVWDFEFISSVFDSMLAVNPLTGGATQQLIDYMTQFHTSTFNPNEVSCVGLPNFSPAVCTNTPNNPIGTTTQTWKLRHDVFFHDGTPVTADDVCASIIWARDAPSVLGQSGVIGVSQCTSLSADTVQVKVQGASPFAEVNVGGVPIIPAHGPHSWVAACGGPLFQNANGTTDAPNAPNSNCAAPNWDPTTGTGGVSGTHPLMVGTGSFVCQVPQGSLTYTDPLGTIHRAGDVGGPCMENGASSALIGATDFATDARILLVANHGYVRGPADLQGTSFQGLTWADKGNLGQVNIVDIADAALHFCTTLPTQCPAGSLGADPYWANPQYVCSGDTSVDICAVATAAGFYNHGTTAPFSPSGLVGYDPQVNPFSAGTSTGGVLSEQLVAEGGTVHFKVANTGTSSASLTNVQIQVGDSSNPFTSIGPFTLAANSITDINTGQAASSPVCTGPKDTSGCIEVTITFNVGTTYQTYETEGTQAP